MRGTNPRRQCCELRMLGDASARNPWLNLQTTNTSIAIEERFKLPQFGLCPITDLTRYIVAIGVGIQLLLIDNHVHQIISSIQPHLWGQSRTQASRGFDRNQTPSSTEGRSIYNGNKGASRRHSSWSSRRQGKLVGG